MFWQRHITSRLAEYCDGRLSAAEISRADAHVATCQRCRADVEAYRAVAGAMKSLPALHAPDVIWRAIDAASAAEQPLTRLTWPSRSLAVAATVVAVSAGAWFAWRERVETIPSGWQVLTVSSPEPASRIAQGSLVQTDAASRVTLRVGDIGEVEVAPNTRVRLIPASGTENRLSLLRGQISARISAPPRFFFVDTSSSTVVDLGCAYTMEVDEEGSGTLRVTTGWASLEWSGRESLVPAGASCHTRPHVGPGTPSFDDASSELMRALGSFDFENGGATSVETVLREARPRDTLTLWHLLSRVDSSQRPHVLDRMIALSPLPAGIDREKVLQLDRDSLTRWREELAWSW
jgi:anti-sigma factor RsiW